MNLVELEPLLPPETIFDLQYAKPYKNTGEVFYEGKDLVPRLDAPAATALGWAAKLAMHHGLRMVVWDAYRPIAVQRRLIELHGGPDGYVLKPEESNHPKGLAVDLTLANPGGKLLTMGTGFDNFTKRAHIGARKLSLEQRQNRGLLRSMMHEVGFRQWKYEWWHFDFVGRSHKP